MAGVSISGNITTVLDIFHTQFYTRPQVFIVRSQLGLGTTIFTTVVLFLSNVILAILLVEIVMSCCHLEDDDQKQMLEKRQQPDITLLPLIDGSYLNNSHESSLDELKTAISSQQINFREKEAAMNIQEVEEIPKVTERQGNVDKNQNRWRKMIKKVKRDKEESKKRKRKKTFASHERTHQCMVEKNFIRLLIKFFVAQTF